MKKEIACGLFVRGFNRIYNPVGAGPRGVRGSPKREKVARSVNSAPL